MTSATAVRRTTTLVAVTLSSVVPLASVGAAPAAAVRTDVPLIGESTGTVSVDLSTTPSAIVVSATGRLSHLGAFTVVGTELFTPLGGAAEIPFTVGGTETLVAEDGDELFGAVTGTGVNAAGASRGTNVVTVSGGTGRFRDARGSYTETYTAMVTSQIGTIVSGPITTTIRGHLSIKTRGARRA